MYIDDHSGSRVQHIEIPDSPVNVVPVADDKASAISEVTSTFPNLGYTAVYAEVRRTFPDVTVDEVRTVMAAAH